MHEVVSWVVSHPDALHHGARTLVADRGERDDLGQLEGDERVLQDGVGTLSRVPLAPGRADQAPPDLDAGCERGTEGRDVEADETDERAGRPDLDGEERW